MTEIVLGTRNLDKIKEIRQILKDIPVKILTFKDFPPAEEIEETGKTLKENALIKARYWAKKTGRWAISEDTGLEVKYLGGAPGVYSSRFAGEKASYEDNYFKLLKLLEGVPKAKREARFRCVVAIVSPQGEEYTVEGEVKGYISPYPQGKEGFGYDPVFFLPQVGKTFAQISQEEKNRLSHRAKAFEKAKALLKRLMEEGVLK